MPLPSTVSRELLHTRQVICQGFRRGDGLWDIEGHLVDTKSYDFERRDQSGRHPAGKPVHEMWVRLTIDDEFNIRDIVVCTDHAPFAICPKIVGAFASLRGLNLTAGFLKETRKRFAGVNGCTHIVELMGPLATTAFQTVFPVLSRERPSSGRPAIIDTCHALAADGPVVAKIWPQFATASSAPGTEDS